MQDADADLPGGDRQRPGIARDLGPVFCGADRICGRWASWGTSGRMITPWRCGPSMTSDFMTAEAAEIPWEVLGKVTSRIVNEVAHVQLGASMYSVPVSRLGRLNLNKK